MNFDFRTLEPITEDYYKLLQESIVFESSEFSNRSEYICKTLEYLTLERGVVTIALSSTSSTKNTLYMSRVPEYIRSKVYNLGIYHTYQYCLGLFSKILDCLYLDSKLISVISVLTASMRELQLNLITQIKTLFNCLIILDRSLLTTYLYAKTVSKDTEFLDRSFIKKMIPKKIFFITSSKKVEKNLAFRDFSAYDNFKRFNFLLSSTLISLAAKDLELKKKLVIIREEDTQYKLEELNLACDLAKETEENKLSEKNMEAIVSHLQELI